MWYNGGIKGFQKKGGVFVKKIINNPDLVVDEMLEGMVAAHPEYIRKLDNADVLVRKNSPIKGKVALVSGGDRKSVV